MYHPYRHLRSLGRAVTMSITPTPGNKPAWWCPESDHILMRPDLKQIERRCALAHELAHRDLGHSGCEGPESERYSARQEREADELAARRLVTLDGLVNTLSWTDDNDEAAADLWVTNQLLDVRLETMYGGERMQVATRLRALGVGQF